jgi:hypothetical protein
MANLVRLVACVAIIIGLLGEFSLGLLLPSRVKIQYASAQMSHLVQVDLPPVDQAASWCSQVQILYCDLLPSR